MLFPFSSRALSPTQCDTVYAIHDAGMDDSQFFTYQLATGVLTPLGSLYPHDDIEAIAIHPQTHFLYATSGQPNAKLYAVDGLTGELQPIGPIGFDNVTGLSFHPQQNILWGWSNQGLLNINIESGKGTLIFSEVPPHFEVQGLAWDVTGTVLYAVVDGPQTQSALWAYDGHTWKVACEGLPDKVESLEMRPDGFLLYGVHNDTQLDVHAYQVQTCQTVFEAYINTPYNDIESLAWPPHTCPTYPPNLEALRAYLEGLAGVIAVTLNPDGSLLVNMEKESYRGQLAPEVIPGTPPPDGTLQLVAIPDANGDGKDDFKVTYPSGDQQVIYYLGVESEEDPPCKTLDAPPLDPTVISIPSLSIQFLYTGSHPLQTGVAEGVINLEHAALLHGQVLTRAGEVLPNVTLSVVGHHLFLSFSRMFRNRILCIC